MPPHILNPLPAILFLFLLLFKKVSVCTLLHAPSTQAAFLLFVSEMRRVPVFAELWANFSPSISSPELRKGNASSLSLSPSGPGAAVPRSNRDVPLPASGKRGNRDCMV